MRCRVLWSEQVEAFVRQHAPEPRRRLWLEIKSLVGWDGRQAPPRIRHLEDSLAGYLRLRVDQARVIFREDFEGGRRAIKCLHAGPRTSVYETFQELLLDELASNVPLAPPRRRRV